VHQVRAHLARIRLRSEYVCFSFLAGEGGGPIPAIFSRSVSGRQVGVFDAENRGLANLGQNLYSTSLVRLKTGSGCFDRVKYSCTREKEMARGNRELRFLFSGVPLPDPPLTQDMGWVAILLFKSSGSLFSVPIVGVRLERYMLCKNIFACVNDYNQKYS